MPDPAGRTGGCQCGAVRYELAADPLALYVCHCRECRRQSASAFGISVIVPRTALRLTAGTPRFWSRPTDTGNTLRCAFCPTCGSRLWHENDAPEISIKGGSLDEPPDLGPRCTSGPRACCLESFSPRAPFNSPANPNKPWGFVTLGQR